MPTWRGFVAALRFAPDCEPHWVPLAGILLGVSAATGYWLAAQVWPTSVAVVLSLFTTALCIGKLDGGIRAVFFPLIKYNALMALSSASTPLNLPEYTTLGLIMIGGHAASRALALSMMGAVRPVTPPVLGVALLLGLAPATLLGLPGLIGLAVAIALRLVMSRHDWMKALPTGTERLDLMQNMTETGFYLGALAAWKFV